MNSSTDKNEIFILIAIIFVITYSVSIIWNTLLTDNLTEIAHHFHTTKFYTLLIGGGVYLIISAIMVNIYVFAFAEKRPIFNSIFYGFLFGFALFLVSTLMGLFPHHNENLISYLYDAIRIISEQIIGAICLGLILVRIKDA